MTLRPLFFPHLGDGGVAVGGRLVSGAPGVEIELVYVRTAASVAFVAEIATASTDVRLPERAVRAEVTRLRADR